VSDRLERRSLTVAVYLTQRWLPTKKLSLRASTRGGYRRNIELHVVPTIGRVLMRQLRVDHLERLYAHLRDDGRADGTGGLDERVSSRSTPCCDGPSMTPFAAG
jgi:hypothetical protein